MLVLSEIVFIEVSGGFWVNDVTRGGRRGTNFRLKVSRASALREKRETFLSNKVSVIIRKKKIRIKLTK